MTPEEQVARALAQPVRFVVPGVGGLSGFLTDPESLAAEVVKALGLYEYRSTGRLRGEGEVREHVMWRTPWREVDA